MRVGCLHRRSAAGLAEGFVQAFSLLPSTASVPQEGRHGHAEYQSLVHNMQAVALSAGGGGTELYRDFACESFTMARFFLLLLHALGWGDTLAR